MRRERKIKMRGEPAYVSSIYLSGDAKEAIQAVADAEEDSISGVIAAVLEPLAFDGKLRDAYKHGISWDMRKRLEEISG